jgi:hypothetical protein
MSPASGNERKGSYAAHAQTAQFGKKLQENSQRFFLVTFQDHSTLGAIPPDNPFSVEHYEVFETSEPSSATQGDLKPHRR